MTAFITRLKRLVEPSPTLTRCEQREQARLLASLMLVNMLFITIYIAIRLPVVGLIPSMRLACVGLVIVTLLYALARSPYYRIGVYLLALAGYLTTAVYMPLVEENQAINAIAVVPIFTLSLFLPVLQTVLYILLTTGTIIGVLAFHVGFGDGYFFVLTSIGMMSALTITVAVVRKNEHTRLHESEARFRVAIEGSQNVFYLMQSMRDEQGKIVDFCVIDANSHGLKQCQMPREQLIGSRMKATFPAEHLDQYFEMCKQVVETGETLKGEDAATAYMWLYYQVVKVGDGVAITSEDITKRKNNELATRESEERYRLLADHISDIISRHDPEGVYLYVTTSCHQVLGYQPDELIGRNAYDFVYPDDMNVLKANCEPVKNKIRILVTYRLLHKQGHYVWVESLFKPIFQGEELVGVVVSTRDITERKQAEAQQMMLQQQRERYLTMQKFIDDISHDLSTPITAMSTSLYIMRRLLTTEQQAERVTKLEKQVAHLTQIVQDMLTISRLDRPIETQFEFAPYNLNLLVQNSVDQQRIRAAEKQQAMSFRIDPRLPDVTCDHAALTIAMTCLLKNAVEYTPEGGKITVLSRLDGERAVVEVRDTGVGIAPDDLPRIFERLYRGQHHRPEGGTGLGLSIVQRIAEVHQGKIEVESEVGKGTTFRLILPLSRKIEAEQE